MNLVGRLDSISHQRFPHAMQGAQNLLLLRVGSDEAHVRARSCFADRFGIHRVILVTLDEGAHKLGTDEFDLMAE